MLFSTRRKNFKNVAQFCLFLPTLNLIFAIDPLTLNSFQTEDNNQTISGARAVIDLKTINPLKPQELICSDCSLQFGGALPYQNSTGLQAYVNLESKYACSQEDFEGVFLPEVASLDPENITTYYLLIKRGECSFSDKAGNLTSLNQKLTAKGQANFSGLVMLSKEVMTPGTSKDSDVESGFLMCTMREECYASYSQSNQVVENPNKVLDFNLYVYEQDLDYWYTKYGAYIVSGVIFLIAIFTLNSGVFYLRFGGICGPKLIIF